MTQKVSDERLGRFARQQNDWFRRVREGDLNPDDIAQAIQQIIDCPPDLQPDMRKEGWELVEAEDLLGHQGDEILKKRCQYHIVFTKAIWHKCSGAYPPADFYLGERWSQLFRQLNDYFDFDDE